MLIGKENLQQGFQPSILKISREIHILVIMLHTDIRTGGHFTCRIVALICYGQGPRMPLDWSRTSLVTHNSLITFISRYKYIIDGWIYGEIDRQ